VSPIAALPLAVLPLAVLPRPRQPHRVARGEAPCAERRWLALASREPCETTSSSPPNKSFGPRALFSSSSSLACPRRSSWLRLGPAASISSWFPESLGLRAAPATAHQQRPRERSRCQDLERFNRRAFKITDCDLERAGVSGWPAMHCEWRWTRGRARDHGL
jgi:hypothetical protein